MSKFKIRHITKYTYEDTVRDSANQIMLYPLKDQYQEVLEHYITITGNPNVSIHQDYFGNEVGTFTHAQPHKELDIDSKLVVETTHRPVPEDTANQELQWREYDNLKHQLEFIDFLKQEKFNALPELQKIIDEE
ncbi:MAG TPA: transglutaminase N-terminal domain-containing protein, partial [Chryseolinea sp.]|nr:transglutaminase N-terminal domain-containing protein [Chryseolinea sp.]